jgi:hypothetical protein
MSAELRVDNKLNCGMDAAGVMNGQYALFSVKTSGDGLVFIIMKDGWKFPSSDSKNGVVVPLTLGFDNNKDAFIGAAARGYMGDGKYPTVAFFAPTDGDNAKNADEFVEAFAHADSMWIKFENGNEQPWTVNMQGSRGAANAFRTCLASLPPSATQPYGNPATQPYDSAAKKKEQRVEATPPAPLLDPSIAFNKKSLGAL